VIVSLVDSARSLDYEMDQEQRRPRPAPRPAPEFSFEQLFLEKYGRIVSVLFRLVGDLAHAEELANEVFLKLYRQPPLERNGNPGGWLYRTAMNLGIDSLRSNARRKQYEQEAGQQMLSSRSAPDPLDDVLRSERRHRVRAVLARLKPTQAQILTLRHSGFSYKELAEILGVARGSVGTMLARAEADFQERYVKLHGNEERL